MPQPLPLHPSGPWDRPSKQPRTLLRPQPLTLLWRWRHPSICCRHSRICWRPPSPGAAAGLQGCSARGQPRRLLGQQVQRRAHGLCLKLGQQSGRGRWRALHRDTHKGRVKGGRRDRGPSAFEPHDLRRFPRLLGVPLAAAQAARLLNSSGATVCPDLAAAAFNDPFFFPSPAPTEAAPRPTPTPLSRGLARSIIRASAAVANWRPLH